MITCNSKYENVSPSLTDSDVKHLVLSDIAYLVELFSYVALYGTENMDVTDTEEGYFEQNGVVYRASIRTIPGLLRKTKIHDLEDEGIRDCYMSTINLILNISEWGGVSGQKSLSEETVNFRVHLPTVHETSYYFDSRERFNIRFEQLFRNVLYAVEKGYNSVKAAQYKLPLKTTVNLKDWHL